ARPSSGDSTSCTAESNCGSKCRYSGASISTMTCFTPEAASAAVAGRRKPNTRSVMRPARWTATPPWLARSIAGEHHFDGAQEDVQIHPQRARFDVAPIQRHALAIAHVVAPAHLPQPGD